MHDTCTHCITTLSILLQPILDGRKWRNAATFGVCFARKRKVSRRRQNYTQLTWNRQDSAPLCWVGASRTPYQFFSKRSRSGGLCTACSYTLFLSWVLDGLASEASWIQDYRRKLDLKVTNAWPTTICSSTAPEQRLTATRKAPAGNREYGCLSPSVLPAQSLPKHSCCSAPLFAWMFLIQLITLVKITIQSSVLTFSDQLTEGCGVTLPLVSQQASQSVSFCKHEWGHHVPESSNAADTRLHDPDEFTRTVFGMSSRQESHQ